MFAGLLELGMKLGVFQRIKQKLIGAPDLAAEKLIEVLQEITKIYEVLDSELNDYLVIWFIENDFNNIERYRRTLISLEAGRIKPRMEEARGHCKKIKKIYDRYLTPWFKRVLDDNEFFETQDLFNQLDMFDLNMMDAIKEVADWLTDRASFVMDLVDANKYDEVNFEIRNDRKMILPDRQKISDIMTELYSLLADFIEISKGI